MLSPGGLEAVLHTLSEGVLIMDERLLLRAVNPKAQTLFGVSGDCSCSLLEATRSIELESLARQSFEQDGSAEQDIKLYAAGEQQYFHVRTALLPQREGVVMALAEFTRLHRLEQVRKDFAANVSHELRTPIQLIKGFAETLLDSLPEDRERIRHYLGIILKNAQTMERLTADLLTLVRLEEGDTLPFAMQETLIYPLLQEAADSVEPAAGKKNITLSLTCPADLKAVLYGPFIMQGVINLLDNGVKYSPKGSKIRLEAEAKDGELVIAVRDKGIGIAPRHLKRIFERFYRVDPARSRLHGGAGLGLAIVRHIASIHRGVAEAESHAGEGSIFRIRIPLK